MLYIYDGEEVDVRVTEYQEPRNKAIMLMEKSEEGLPMEEVSPYNIYTVATTNLEGVNLAEDEVMVKNWSENEGIGRFLLDNGFIEEGVIRSYTSGFVNVPVYRLTKKAMELYKRDNK